MDGAVWTSYPGSPVSDRRFGPAMRVSGWLALFCIVTIAAGWNVPLNNDVSWQYWVARQLRGGTALYRDIVEVNPPLWFWEAVPISWFAEWLGIATAHMVIVATTLRVAFGLWLTWLVCRDDARLRMAAILPGLALILCVLPLHDIGEREHLMLFGAIPYAALIGRRASGMRVSAGLATMIGIAAGYAFALKPHFVIVPLMLEAWLALSLRRGWRPLRPETITIGLVMTLYAAAILAFAPAYLTETIPHALAAYGAFAPPFSALLLQPWLPAWILGGLAILTAWSALPSQARSAAVAALGLALCYFVQGKGFSYQAMAVSAMLAWTLWLVLSDGGAIGRNAAKRPLAALALVLMTATVAAIGSFAPYRAGRLSDAVERLPAGSSVAVISAHSWLAFPMVEQRGFVWPLREIGIWTLPLIARQEPDGAMRRTTSDALAHDLWCRPPAAILMDDPAQSPALQGTGFSYRTFMESDPRLAELLRHYTVETDGGYRLYRLRQPLAARGTACRTISSRR